ncbi:putative quinol monooxygenase [Paenibacillus beijingensis]|uniref:ABM domain-containing protein n=1 Tax=Paenibacillus beijingensis TaxID=1126833 RepID=A0A0D5NE25_9BACL|nr:putative quinol monooxygenase [Paenibacillus beijingensis]AJY73619.1 hypothetical protein VN24_01980 [Paenibacillus beijingensis]
MVIIHAYFHVRTDALEAFMEQTKPLIESSTAEPGNISYALYRDVDQPNVLIMVEEWKDEQAVAIHNETPHLLQFLHQTKPLLAKPIQLKKYTVQS